jgi:hypothetical protein
MELYKFNAMNCLKFIAFLFIIYKNMKGGIILGCKETCLKCPYRELKCITLADPQGPYDEANIADCSCPCPKYQAYLAVQDPEQVKTELATFGLSEDIETWTVLMTMQKRFANRFHKVDGLTKEEQDHWINEYLVCIEDEVREVREHLSFYTGAIQDINQSTVELKKEIIDILHFMMDEFIVGGIDSNTLKQYYLKQYAPNIVDVKDFLKFAYERQSLVYDWKDQDKYYNIFILVNKLLDCSGKVRQQISWKHWKKPSPTIDYDKLYTAFAETFKILVDLFVVLYMTSDEVRDIYIKKNLENIFRQNYNY